MNKVSRSVSLSMPGAPGTDSPVFPSLNDVVAEPDNSPATFLAPQMAWRPEELICQAGPVDLERLAHCLPGGEQLPDDPLLHLDLLLRGLFQREEMVFLGGRYDVGRDNVHSAVEWVQWLHEARDRYGMDLPRRLGQHLSQVVANPLTGQTGRSKSGKLSFRCDACVAAWRFACVDFAGLSKPDQLSLARAVQLRIAAIIDGGGDRLRFVVRVDAQDATAWGRLVKHELFHKVLLPLGANPGTQYGSCLSPTPGALDPDTGVQTRLLFICPFGGYI